MRAKASRFGRWGVCVQIGCMGGRVVQERLAVRLIITRIAMNYDAR
ncbi:MAG: hypothetical protein ACXV4C_07910 [Halobacteriota archaeon]